MCAHARAYYITNVTIIHVNIKSKYYFPKLGSFYNYEPLTYAGIRRIYQREEEWSSSAKKVVAGLLGCNFSLVLDECKL